MIGAYGRFGDMNKALALFQEMEQKGLKQNQAYEIIDPISTFKR
jgi:pentatricopeptide repeat protein